jgi:FkbM family methyltransferase
MLTRLPDVTDAATFWQMLSNSHGHSAFDIGANVGQAAAVLAPHFKHVYSFEPCAEALAVLMVEAPMNVVVIPQAVSSQAGTLELDETAESIKSGQLTTGTGLGWGPVVGHRTVEATTVDAACARFGVTPDLVKIDTEGHEVKVLEGAPILIKGRHTCWLIEVHSREFETPIRDLLKGYVVDRVEHDILVHTCNPQQADHFYLRALP